MNPTMRRTAVLFAFLSAAGCTAFDGDDAAVGEVSQGLATDLALYTDGALASPWQSWSWSSNVSTSNADAPKLTGSTSQIKFAITSAWGALSLARSSGNLAIGDYESISFDVRGTASSTLYLDVETLAGSAGTQVTVPVTTTWAHKTISVSSLKGGLATFGKINWMGPKSGQTFYVDNVRLVAKVATTSLPSATYPTTPLTVTKNDVVALSSSAGSYYLYVPSSYDATHNTPSKVLVWMHGCGGNAYGDAWSVSPGGTQSWITVSVGGRDGTCWTPSTDTTLVLAALDDVKKRVNVDPHRVVIGGYSSGGDMAYRTVFYNASRFAGIIAENTSPFRDTESTQSASLAASSWKFHVAHLAHLSDTTYPIAGVRAETDALTANGYPMTRIERAGTHWDNDTASSGTNYDLRTYLLPYLDAGWTSP